jgi:hypothetical protein
VKYCIPLLFIIAICIASLSFRRAAPTVAGPESCRPCHRAICDSFALTAHAHASGPASEENIKGSFATGSNLFAFNQLVSVLMEKDGNKFFQSARMNETEFRKESMDIVIGSGRKGQTYLYWRDNLIFQDPISYYTPADCWCNSPGYPRNGPFFARVTNARCFECHASAAQVEDSSTYDVAYFKPNGILYGIDCERCHGGGAEHVRFQTEHPDEKTAKFIWTKNELTRTQKLDACSLCHSGIGVSVKPPFSFKTGDTLTNYIIPRYNPDSVALLDVHGNQYGLLSSSKCFLNSQLTCSSCHKVHQTEINEPKVFSARCVECHNPETHNECTVKADFILSDNCIDCHMPLLPSKAITLQLVSNKKATPDLVRTHRIAIYPQIAEEFEKKKGRSMIKKY